MLPASLRPLHVALALTLLATPSRGAAPAGGTLWGMGRSFTGALGPHGADFVAVPLPVASHVQTAAVGMAHTLFVTNDGALFVIGSNYYGQLGLGADISRADTPEKIADDVTAVAAGGYHSLFLKRDRTLWGMGGNSQGALGDATTTLRYKPQPLADDVIAMAAGYTHSFFVTSDGTLWATGANGSGQLGNGTATDALTPVNVATGVKTVAAGAYFSAFVKTDGTLWTMGDNVAGQLGDGTTTARLSPVQIATDVASVSAGGYFMAFVKTDGTLWVCGDNPNGQLGTGDTSEVHTPIQIASDVTAAAAGFYHLLFRKTDGTVWATGSNWSYQQGDDPPLDQRTTPAPVATGIAAIFAGGSNSLFLDGDGTLTGVGKNDDGQLGGGSPALHVPVRLADDVTAVAAGTHHTAFLTSDRTLWTTGYNDYGQLADGTTRDRYQPAPVASDVTAVAAGAYNTFFIKTDATLWGAGKNLRGQLADGTTTDRAAPVQLASDVLAVSASDTHALWIKSDHTLWAAGWNHFGELQVDGPPDLTTPVLLANDVVRARAGAAVTVYLTSDGVLHARGDLLGGLGLVGRGIARTPVDLATNVADFALGGSHVLVLKTDGSLHVAGRNRYGQLGLLTVNASGYTTRAPDQPDFVPLTTGVTAIAAGFAHSVFLRNDGTLWATGFNTDGQLGNGTTIDSDAPILVASGVQQIAAGPATTFFLQPSAPVVTAQPTGGALGNGVTLSVTATGSTPLAYRWFLEGEPLPGATTETLTATGPGSYRALVGGTVWSDAAVLTTPSRLVNLSTRARVGAGERTLIAGFAVSGPAGPRKSVLLRGVGPALARFGVTQPLAQPQVALFDEHGNALESAYLVHTVIYDGPGPVSYLSYPFDLAGLTAQVGAFPLNPDEASAVRPDLVAAGRYTFHVSTADASDGVALAELYEADRDPLPLVNLSTRAWAGRGENALIAGFVLTGSQPATLLIRGVGPSLTAYGIAEPLAAPQLELYDQTGALVAANTRWSTATDPAALAHAAASVGAFPLPDGSADSALLVTLPPGVFTVHVSGAGGTEGVALVEVYLLAAP